MLAGSRQQLKQTFPVLKVPDIVDCLNEVEIGFKLTEEEILKPTYARVAMLYESIAEILMHNTIPADNFQMMEILEHPELHKDSIKLLSLFQLLLQLLPNIGIDDFGLVDLIKPEPARYKRILSGIINFVKFREERSLVFEKCTLESETAISNAKTLQTKHSELDSKVSHIKYVQNYI